MVGPTNTCFFFNSMLVNYNSKLNNPRAVKQAATFRQQWKPPGGGRYPIPVRGVISNDSISVQATCRERDGRSEEER